MTAIGPPEPANDDPPRSGRLAAALLFIGGLLLAGIGFGAPNADADELLANGAFESWDNDTPSGWRINVGQGSREDGLSVSGASLHVTATGTTGMISQVVPASPGSTISASVSVAADASATAELRIVPLDDGFQANNTTILQSLPISPGGFKTISMTTGDLPPGTAYIRFEVVVTSSGPLSAYFDDASAQETVAPPTATPTETPTPDESPAGTPAASTTSSPAGGGGSATPASTKAATRTPTARPPTRTPTSKKPPRTPTPNLTPTPSNPEATMNGLLLNGDFEALDNGKPAYWAKYGGEMGATNDAGQGAWAATLTSETSSTKWLTQVVPVKSGGWYALSALARAENARAFLRVSWYQSADGSGTAMDSADGTATEDNGWTRLETGPLQAPEGAGSARIKLMLGSQGGYGRVVFDDAWFEPSNAPPPAATPPGAPTNAGRSPTRAGTAKATPGPSRTPAARVSHGSATSPGNGAGGAQSAAFAADKMSPLRLSEFMSDPPRTGTDASDEWVELVNISTGTVSTEGWRLGDAKTSVAIPAVSIPSGGYLVVAAKTAELPVGIPVARLTGSVGSGLNNAGDVLTLVAPGGTTGDVISYGDDATVFEPPPPAPGAGRTLGIRDPVADPAAENWDITLQPSPGEPNIFAAAKPDARSSPGAGGAASPVSGADLLSDRGSPGGGGLTTLDWILLGALLLMAAAAAPALARRYGAPAWKRIRRGR